MATASRTPTRVPVPPSAEPGERIPGEPGRTPLERLGLTTATSLIVGSIVGVGIFNLPGSLSAYGPITLLSMVLVTAGALALALLFAGLSRRLPTDGSSPQGFLDAAVTSRIAPGLPSVPAPVTIGIVDEAPAILPAAGAG